MTEHSVDALVDRADRALDTLYGTSENLAELRVRRRSDDGVVTVEIDGSGALVGLELAEDLSRESARQLCNSIVDTAAAAARDALDARELILQRMQSSLSAT